jgi:hypothetical protein
MATGVSIICPCCVCFGAAHSERRQQRHLWMHVRVHVEDAAWRLLRCRIEGHAAKLVDRRQSAITESFCRISEMRAIRLKGACDTCVA